MNSIIEFKNGYHSKFYTDGSLFKKHFDEI